MTSTEQILEANGVALCVQTFGDPADPTILLIHGASASMLWWEDELCTRLAAGGRHVVRFDNRDTGRSVSYPAGQPGYSLRDLADDAVGVLDALDVPRAHVVGRSMAGAIALLAASHHPRRVASLTLVSTTPGGPGLPPMSDAFLAYVSAGGPDPSDPDAVVEHIVGLMRVHAGGSTSFDEEATRALAERDVARAGDIAATLTNHFVIDLGDAAELRLDDLTVPTLVVHGALDPVFPPAHGRALADRIPGATLLLLDDVGHELPPASWDVVVPALLAHTS